VSVCVLSLPDIVNFERHSDDFAQMAWNRIKRDIFRESPSAPQKYVGLPPPTINKVIGNSEKESIIVHVYI
tara:strand:+ start:69 stop:281 length:213 start_codon:yes stop_codon:yes gene_type:complete